MNDELIVISKADLEACDRDRVAYLNIAVKLFNELLQRDADFKGSLLYDLASEVLITK